MVKSVLIDKEVNEKFKRIIDEYERNKIGRTGLLIGTVSHSKHFESIC